MTIRALPHRVRRAHTISVALTREALHLIRLRAMRFGRRPDYTTAAERLVKTLLQLGPTFVKVGQILSTRPDFLPREYVAALESLQQAVPAFPFEQARAVAEEALGRDLASLFSSFDEMPVAAASLAQVHFAVLQDGSPVAVKVQRPNVRAQIEDDMAVFGALVQLGGVLLPGPTRNLNLAEGFAEFRRYTLQELDFAHEGHTIERFRANFRDWHDVIFPTVHWNFTTAKVLTMSRVSGRRLQVIVPTLGPAERQKLNRRILELEMKMFVSDGLFHADLHPGNILFDDNGTIGLLDFGMYGELTERERNVFILYFLAIVQHRLQRAFGHLVSLARPRADADKEAYYRRFRTLADRFLAGTLAEMSFTQAYLQILLAGAHFGFVFPAELLLQAKAITTAEMLGLMLVPDMRFEVAARPIILKQFLDRALDLPRLIRQLSSGLPELLLGAPMPASDQDDAEEDSGGGKAVFTEMLRALGERADPWRHLGDLVPFILGPVAHSVLAGQLPLGRVEPYLQRVQELYGRRIPSVPPASSMGATLMVHLAAITVAMDDGLREEGVSIEDSMQLVRDMTWQVYSKMGELPWLLEAARGGGRTERLKGAINLFLTFPFSGPDYVWRDTNAEARVVGFDMLRCPVADYFRAQGRSDLCVQTWCNLDFALAKQWGGATLERTTTIAGGSERCDFRWHVGPSEDS